MIGLGNNINNLVKCGFAVFPAESFSTIHIYTFLKYYIYLGQSYNNS